MTSFFAGICGFQACFFYSLGSLIAGLFSGLVGFDASFFGSLSCLCGIFARFLLFGGCAGSTTVAVGNGAALFVRDPD
jgi:hypothetical protein